MASHMSQASVDVLVVGGGPAGLYAAEQIARRGHGVLASESFCEFDRPRDITLNALTTARFVSPSGLVVDYATPSPLATVIDRVAFDRALADRARAAGAEVRVGARVSSLEPRADGVTAIAGDDCIHARLAV